MTTTLTKLQQSDVKNYQGIPCLVDPALVGHHDQTYFEAIHIATDTKTDSYRCSSRDFCNLTIRSDLKMETANNTEIRPEAGRAKIPVQRFVVLFIMLPAIKDV